MKVFLTYLFSGGLFVLSLCLSAQHKLYFAPSYWTNLSLFAQPDSLHFFWFEAIARHTVHSSEFNSVNPQSDNIRYNFTAGYQYRIHPNIQLGITATNTAEKYSYWQLYRGFGIHRGNVLGFDFDKQISLEVFDAPTSFNGKRLFRYAFHAGLYRNLKVAGLSCRAGAHLGMYRISEDVQSVAPNRRRIDKTRLRTEWLIKVSPAVEMTIFAMRETDYWHQVGLFDEQGNTISPDGNVNRILPTYGVAFHLKLGQQQGAPWFYW